MFRFIETLRIERGVVFNLGAHERRLNETRNAFFPDCEPLAIAPLLTADSYRERTRCRVEYARNITQIEYIPYSLRRVSRLKCVDADTLDYRFKYADRSALNQLFERRGNADDILIIRNNLLTDTSICNIALWDGTCWVTPATPLLYGTMREKLLSQNRIQEKDIAVANLVDYQRIRLFNALIDFGEVELAISECFSTLPDSL